MTSIELGGWFEAQDATEETQKICDQVKHQVEEKTGKNYVEYKAIEYRNQLENGETFLIKVHVGGTDYIHLKVHQIIIFVREVPSTKVFLQGVEQHKTKDDPLVPFTN
ncbi:cystatin-A1-like [Perca flavescens]|uniref:cystatin-A1-like n=1 Tax=Perca flavescens TaxID=8167 RepID=UPI00106ED330|nr:cystatin-A1-like [Perca flavescens]